MKRALANFLLNLAIKLGAKRVTVNVIKDGYSEAAADALLTAKPDWSPDEAAAVDKFLKSDAGASFLKRVRAVAAQVAIKGAANQVNTIHAAGISHGWNECVRYIFSLSRVSRVEDTTPNAEQAPQDEASLLEQLSP